MTAAQTVSAAMCCQTLRGEEGKREQGYSHRNFGKLRHFTYPPFSDYPGNKLDVKLAFLFLGGLNTTQLSLLYTYASAKRNKMYYFAE